MVVTSTKRRTNEAEAEPRSAWPGTPPAGAPRGHIGRIVTGSLLGGLLGAVGLVMLPLAGAQEHVITGSVLLVFAASWLALAVLSQRWTDQPQRWAHVPAAFMGISGAAVLIVAPTGNELGWVWPPLVMALAGWMIVRAHHDLRSRTRRWVVYPVCVVLALACVGGAYETFREATDELPMAGRLIDVGGHSLHIDCRGSGSPTVVLEAGLGEPSTDMAWIRRDVAATTRVCVYDRAGRGWSESADGAQDGVAVATDLHILLDRAGEQGPFVLAGHSAGGIYVMNYAHRYPGQVAGVVLLDSMSPDQYRRIASWPAFYEMFRRTSGVLPSLSRLGIGRAVTATAYSGLPPKARDEARAFNATPRGARSLRDEFSKLRSAMAQAKGLTTLGDRPLVVLTAQKDAQGGWMAAQDELATLSTNSAHQVLPHASHAMLTEDETTAARSSRAIGDVVRAVRTGTPVTMASLAHAPSVRSGEGSVLPKPTGRFAIGVSTVPSVSPDATTRVWYPARRGTGTGAPTYLADEVAGALGIPTSLLPRVVPQASVDAEFAPTRQPRPAVVLMPGWGLPMALSTTLAQELASNGYVVVAVDPTFGSEDRASLPADTANPGRRLEQVAAAVDFATGRRITAIAGPIDAKKVAVGGHSIAGAVAFQTSLTDPRVGAVFDLDGWLHGAALETPVTVPALVVDASGLEPASRAIVARTPTAVTVGLSGATHSDVTDVPCLADALGETARRALGLGSVGCAGATTTNRVVLRFLDATLRNDSATPSTAELIRGLGPSVRT